MGGSRGGIWPSCPSASCGGCREGEWGPGGRSPDCAACQPWGHVGQMGPCGGCLGAAVVTQTGTPEAADEAPATVGVPK